ncbi:porphobilinogen synthase [Oscillospiraceae bacterium CM]|nr:porphobilinogen synthase [Oscillospiraceae bacterium CM]
MDLVHRPRRLRGAPALREMVRETRISKASLIYPLFIKEGNQIAEEIAAMPGQFRYSVDRLPAVIEPLLKAGIDKVLLFGIPDGKDALASGAYADDGIVQKALIKIKAEYPSVYCVTDVCLCEYSSHGHCGVISGHAVDNDKTLPLLAKTALSQAQAGADMVAPSDMMDGRVAAIRACLDQNSYSHIPIMSYAVKYSSAFYGPFRDAAGSAPAFGDRRGYQMDYHNKKEALKEAALDLQEGADILMVKPALSYLDVIDRVSAACNVPTAAYSVSGEYAMIKSAARAGYVDESSMICETTASIFRAGADILISYYAPEIAGLIDAGRLG